MSDTHADEKLTQALVLGYLHGVESARGANPRQGSASQQLDLRAARATPLVDRRPPRADPRLSRPRDADHG